MVSGSEGKAGGFWLKGDGGVKVWRVSDGQCVYTASHQTGDITAFQVSRRRRAFAGLSAGVGVGVGVGAGAGSSAEATSTSTSRSDEPEVSGVMSASKDGTVVEWEIDWTEENFRGGSHNIKWSSGFLNR